MKKILCVLFTTVLSFSLVFAQAKFINGKDYVTLPESIGVTNVGAPEIVEFFWYGCPHCFALEPATTEWLKNKKPAATTFYRVPATGGGWTFAAQAKYTADKLGLKDNFHKAYFDEYHLNKNLGVIHDKDKFFEFLAKNFKVSKENAETAWSSYEVKKNIESADKKAKIAGINGVPAFVVNGKYLVDVANAGSEARLFEILDFLAVSTKAE